MDEDYIVKPRKWDASGISKFMIYIGPISSIFDYATFAVFVVCFQSKFTGSPGSFPNRLVRGEFIITNADRTHDPHQKDTVYTKLGPAAPVVALTSAIMLIGILLPFSPIAGAFKLVALPLAFFPWLIVILFAYCLLTQVIKNWFIKKFSHWL